MPQETYLQRQQRLDDAKAKVRAGYQSSLGRDASDDEVLSHLGGGNNFNPDNVQWALANIDRSDEAVAYRNRAQTPDAPTATNETTGGGPQIARAAGPAHLATAAAPSAAVAPAPPPSASRPNVAKPTGVGRAVVTPTSTYLPGQLAARAQGPGFTQYTDPNPGQVPQLNRQLIESILANPETMSTDVVNQLKARGRDTAVNMAGQLRDGAHADVASRGFSDVGGMRAGYDRQIDSQLISDILNSNRDIDITAASTNRADQLAAATAGTDWENGLVNRADANYKARLLGESTASDSLYRDNALDLDRFKTIEAAAQAADASTFRNDAFKYDQIRDDRNQTLQEFLGQEGVNLDWARLDESANQFDSTFGEGKRQFNNSLGFNYASLNASQQARLMDQINAILDQG